MFAPPAPRRGDGDSSGVCQIVNPVLSGFHYFSIFGVPPRGFVASQGREMGASLRDHSSISARRIGVSNISILHLPELIKPSSGVALEGLFGLALLGLPRNTPMHGPLRESRAQSPPAVPSFNHPQAAARDLRGTLYSVLALQGVFCLI